MEEILLWLPRGEETGWECLRKKRGIRCQLCGETHIISLKSLINGALIIEKNADEKAAPFDRQNPEKTSVSCLVHIYCLGLNVRDEFIWGWQIHYALKGAREMSVACVREERRERDFYFPSWFKSNFMLLSIVLTARWDENTQKKKEKKKTSPSLWIKVLPPKKGTQVPQKFLVFTVKKINLKTSYRAEVAQNSDNVYS